VADKNKLSPGLVRLRAGNEAGAIVTTLKPTWGVVLTNDCDKRFWLNPPEAALHLRRVFLIAHDTNKHEM